MRTTADAGYQLCYECGGDGACVPCTGTGMMSGRHCSYCHGTKICNTCKGKGQILPRKLLFDK